MEDSVKIKTEIEEKLHLLGDDVSDINFIFIYLFILINRFPPQNEQQQQMSQQQQMPHNSWR